jgi:E3 ubiquitin-protein ligase DOA10
MENDQHLPPVLSQTIVYICAVWPGSIIFVDWFKVFMFLFSKLIMDS